MPIPPDSCLEEQLKKAVNTRSIQMLAWRTLLVLELAVLGIGTASAQITRVSVAGDGAQANGHSQQSDISADGRWIVFQSEADSLTPGDTNGAMDVFLKDLQTGAITRVSASKTGGDSNGFAPSIATMGRRVAFTSTAPLVAEDTATCPAEGGSAPGTCSDVYLYDHDDGSLTLISVSSQGAQGNGPSTAAVIGAGAYVAFASTASNLVASDTNGVSDVFLYNLLSRTTERVSIATDESQSTGPSYWPVISDDGGTIGFLSAGGASLDPSPDPIPCNLNVCFRPYIRVHRTLQGATGTGRVPFEYEGETPSDVPFNRLAMSDDGSRVAAVAAESIPRTLVSLGLPVRTRVIQGGGGGIAVSRNGRFLASCDGEPVYGLTVRDLDTGFVESVPSPPSGIDVRQCSSPSVSGDGLIVTFTTQDPTLVTGDTNGRRDVFVFDRDLDDDGMPNAWETAFGLNPNDAADAAADADGDGVTNRDEYALGSHPRGTFKRYLAEGAANGFFRTEIHLLNPGAPAADITPVVVQYLGFNGLTTTQFVPLAQGAHTTLVPEVNPALLTTGKLPADLFSTIVESDRPIVVERSMSWEQVVDGQTRQWGRHAETGIAEPRTTWYLAEGATHGPFDLFYLVQNPQDVAVDVEVTYLLQAPRPPVVHTYPLAARSRLTIDVDAQLGDLGAAEISAKIVSTLPVLVERAQYLSTPDMTWAGGHVGAAIPEPLTEWFVAEGVTGTFFHTYLLVGNPSDSDAQLTVSYFLEDGTTFDKTYVARAQSRLTIDLNTDDPRLAATSVSAMIRSSNGVPVVVERATWWPDSGWYEGHLSAATSGGSRRWGVASAQVRASDATSTYLLIANPSAQDGVVTISLRGIVGASEATCSTTVTARAHSRLTVDVGQVCARGADDVIVDWAGTVESDCQAGNR